MLAINLSSRDKHKSCRARFNNPAVSEEAKSLQTRGAGKIRIFRKRIGEDCYRLPF